MAATSLKEVYKAIGTMTAEVAGLRKDLKEIEERNAENTRRADESRANVHCRLDEVVLRTSHLENDVVSVKRTVDDMQEVTDEVKAWKQRGIGALFVAGVASASLSGTIVYFWDELIRVLRGI